MSHRRKVFIPRNNSKGYVNQPFRARNEHDNRKKLGITMDFSQGSRSAFKHQGRYDPQNNRFDGYRGRDYRKNGGRHRYQDNRPRPVTGRQDMQSSWFKISVPFGKKLEKDVLLKSLMSCSKTSFVPTNYQVVGGAAVFHVDDAIVADALRQCSKRLTSPDGSKISIFVSRNSPPPSTPLNEENLQKIKVAMSNNFDTDTQALNLRSLHTNPELRAQGLYAPLSRQHILQAVVKIITSNIPQIRSLDLSSNRLSNVHGTSELISVCKDLKSVNLNNNMIGSINDLNSLKGNVIEELILDGNTLCDHYKDQETYISDVRSKFPRVIKLDGKDLPPPILFDLGTTETLPAIKGSYFPSQDLAANVLQFLETYFTFYDSGNRKPLEGAYHPEAVYSLQVPKQPSIPQESKYLAEYLYNQGNRNLFKVTDTASRENCLRQGKSEIVSHLCGMPRTQHYANSITVDVAHLSTALMMFTVSGLFKEVDLNINTMKAFTRTFLVVPHDQGILIINETHLVASPTKSQIKTQRAANASASSQPTSSTNEVPVLVHPVVPGPQMTVVPGPQVTVVPVSPLSANNLTEETKKQLIIQMVNLSRMNVPYSTKCLEEKNWDLEGAMAIFTELNNKGGIPAEAFQPL